MRKAAELRRCISSGRGADPDARRVEEAARALSPR